MTIDEIKIGTKFTYVGQSSPNEALLIQTVDKIQNGYITSTFANIESIENCFDIDSQYMKDCEIIQQPSTNTMKKEFTYKGLDFKCTIEFNTSEKIVQYQIVNLHKITIEDGLGRLKLSTESDYNNLPQHILKLENTVKYYVDYVHNIKEKDSIQQLLKDLGFSE